MENYLKKHKNLSDAYKKTQKEQSMKRKNLKKKHGYLTWTLRLTAGILTLLLMLIFVGNKFAPDFTKIKTPAGYTVNVSTYLTLNKNTEIWINVWLPETLEKGKKIPALMETSRYGEQLEAGWLYKCLQTFMGKEDINKSKINSLLDNGYASVWVQSPGSCQSSGPRPIEYPPSDIDAMNLAVEWISAQPWSNGKVGAFGTSYSGTTADMICATGHPGVKAVYAMAPDFDTYSQLVKPGGLGSSEFIRIWGKMVKAMDNNSFLDVIQISEQRELGFFEKLLLRSYVKGLKIPKDREKFEKALVDHKTNLNVDQMANLMEYRDTTSENTSRLSLEEISLYRYKYSIEAAKVNNYTKVGWMDSGVVEGALQKYLTFDTPQYLVIQPSGHVFSEIVDPFTQTRWKTDIEKTESKKEFFDYFDRFLKNDGEILSRKIRYFTYGSNTWNETKIWPPEGTRYQPLYFSTNNQLKAEPENTETGNDKYSVNFTATTGKNNRWMTQMGHSVQLPDRSKEDKKLLTYTSEPMNQDTEVTGSPVVYLYLSSTHKDGAFHVYLEDVAPDGRVTYLTEGLLRGVFRKTASPKDTPYASLGIYRTFHQQDAEPMIPGETVEIPIQMFPISVVFKKGHCIRVAFAGFDQSMGNRYPDKGNPVITVERNISYPSHIIIPVR